MLLPRNMFLFLVVCGVPHLCVETQGKCSAGSNVGVQSFSSHRSWCCKDLERADGKQHSGIGELSRREGKQDSQQGQGRMQARRIPGAEYDHRLERRRLH